MRGYDAWLEAPYVAAAQKEAAFEAWCEETGTDYEAPDAWDRFEQAQAEAYEDWAEREAEARRDARL